LIKKHAGNQIKMKEKVAPTKVVLGAASDKLPFTLIANIATISVHAMSSLTSKENSTYDGHDD
jgi:hypothetical protein